MLKIGQVIGILNSRNYVENTRYEKYRVVRKIEKKRNSMYICEHVKTGVRTAITDVDIFTSLNGKKTQRYSSVSTPIIKIYKYHTKEY